MSTVIKAAALVVVVALAAGAGYFFFLSSSGPGQAYDENPIKIVSFDGESSALVLNTGRATNAVSFWWRLDEQETYCVTDIQLAENEERTVTNACPQAEATLPDRTPIYFLVMPRRMFEHGDWRDVYG